MTRADILRELGWPQDDVVSDLADRIERVVRLAEAAEREAAMKDAERYRHAMREAMYLLDQPEPRPHAAFSELLLALNPAIDNRKKSAIDAARGEA